MDNTPEQIVDSKQYKWLVSSCLQKSLRRGRFDLAQHYVKFLWEHDRNYLTYRFGTILAEDVGIANMNLVKEYLDTKLGKKAIDEKGGLDFFLKLTESACLSNKDRSSCDAGYLANWSGTIAGTDHEKISLDNTVHYIERIHSSWIILGDKKFKNSHLPFSNQEKDNIEGYGELVTKLIDSNFADTTVKAYSTQIENIFLGMPIMEAAYRYESTLPQKGKIPVGHVIENTYIKEESYFHKGTGLELISCGIDGHTREGKSVYYQFLKTKNPFTQYLNDKGINYQEHINLFSHCMFRVEGHEVNKRIYFPTAVQVMRDCESDILNAKANRQSGDLDFAYLRKVILESIPTINKMRERQLEVAPIPMIDKPIPKEPKKPKIKV